jgi:perosamine synthetase
VADVVRSLQKEAPRFRIGLVGYEWGQEEVDAIRDVLASGRLTGGPRVAGFEEAFAARHQVEHAVALANGTVALAAMYLALGIGPGDEVIVPSMTFVSTATSVLHVGAKPVFAEVDPLTFNLDPNDVAARLTPRTRAIVAVHYGGQPADMSALARVAARANVFLLEDAAEAHGSSFRGRSVGGLGKAAMFSFTPTKNITIGEGGMVTTDDAELAARIRLLRTHGQTEPYLHAMVGFNWRLTDIQAAMGEVQLGRLDGIIARKRANAAWVAQRLAHLPGVRLPTTAPGCEHVYMLYTLLVERGRDEVMSEMRRLGVEARLYFPPAHLQPIFKDEGARLPVTEQLAQQMLSIPFHCLLTENQLEDICATLERAVAQGATPSR